MFSFAMASGLVSVSEKFQLVIMLHVGANIQLEIYMIIHTFHFLFNQSTEFLKTRHVFPVVSRQGYTDHYLVAISMLRRQRL